MTNAQHHIPKRAECSACGTAQVNHRLFYLGSIIDDTITKVSDFLFGWINAPSEGPFADAIMGGCLNFFRLFGMVKFSDDISKVASGRTELIWQEAKRREIPMQQIIMFGKPLEQYRARLQNRWVYFQSIPIPPWFPTDSYKWIDDKYVLCERLHEAGIAAPRARSTVTLEESLRAFDELTKPVIIKPRSGSRARHTTTNIRTKQELIDAHNLGKMIARTLLVEEHLDGKVCRATVVDNKLVGFFQTDPPHVTGDGTHTIRELIQIQNNTKPEKISDIIITDDVISFIARKHYTLESVLAKGEILDLTAKTGRFLGGYTAELITKVHPRFHEIFKKARELTQAPVTGFDLIVPDPLQNPDEQTWGIIECNSMPYIDVHYFAYEGEPVDIAKNIWDLWDNKPSK